MSVKRQATSELNHDNWDDEDPADDKKMGQFQAASKDVLQKRDIRLARRRNKNTTEASRNVFSGFGGLNKTQPTSFEFLANLTNGTKSTNGSGTSSETSTTSDLFTNKPAAPSSGLFGAQSSTSPVTSQPTMMTSPFGSSVKTSHSSLFTATKVDSAKEPPFKIQPVSSPAQIDTPKPTGQTSSLFGVSSTSADDSKQLFSSTNSTPFKIQPVSSTNTAMVQTSFGITTPAVTTVTPEKKTDDSEKSSEKKIKYFSKLKGLNESVSDWISKHVVQTPLCILSPIFKDYEKYLKEITEEYQTDKEPDNKMDDENPAANTEKDKNAKTSSIFAINNSGPSTFTTNTLSENSKTSTPFGTSNFDVSTSKITTSNQDAKISTPFGMNSTGPSPSNKQDTKTTSLFTNYNNGSAPMTSPNTKTSTSSAINNAGSSPSNSQNTKTSTLFGINNTGSSTLISQNAKTSTPFGINEGSSPLNSQNIKTSTPIAINTGSSPSNSQDTKTFASFGMNAGSTPLKSQDTKTSTLFGTNNNDTSPFNSSPSSATPKPSLFAQNNLASSPENKQPAFSFGIKTPTTNASSPSTPSTGLSFGVTPSAAAPTTSPLPSNASTNQTTTAPFSFGIGKSFSFSPSTVQQPSSEPAATENEDEPPKVEYTPVKEDNSLYEKKCKIFVKKDGNYADKGVGTLYIKKIEGNVKHQLLVRANTNLGTVLLNLVLAEAIPTQKMGKNNVMLVCIPTPDAEPPPTTVLIRVKTGDEADELLQTLNKYKA